MKFALAVLAGATTHTMKSILIVDGDESVAQMFAEVFASHDWRVIMYSDGRRAGEHLGGSAHYDAVLVGYRFEGVDGVDLIKQIRTLDHRQDVPIVMVTGIVEVSVMAAALTAGADDVLYKPTDVAIVVATVNECIGRRGRHQDT
jgi:DNA-binding response OmpR family regulator